MRQVKLSDNLLKVFFMVIRGIPFYMTLRKNNGLILIGNGARIRNSRSVKSEGRLIVENYAEIQGLSTNGVIFGENVSVGSQAIIRCSGYYSRDVGVGLTVGSNSNIGIQSYIGCGGGVSIGKNVMMGPKVSIHSENHNFSDTDTNMKNQGVRRSTTTIGDNVWLATGCRIMSGVYVGEGSVVAAGAVVTNDVAPNTVVGGVPAKVISDRNLK